MRDDDAGDGQDAAKVGDLFPHLYGVLPVSAVHRIEPLRPGVHALSNASLNTPWPKLRRLRDVILTSGGDMLGLVYTHRRFYIPERVYRWL